MSNQEESIIYTRKGASKDIFKDSELFDLTPCNDNDTSKEILSFLGVNIHEWLRLRNTEALSIFYFLLLKFRISETFLYWYPFMSSAIASTNILKFDSGTKSGMVVGSLAEETYISEQSDIDMMYVDTSKLVVEEGIINKDDVVDTEIYLADMNSASPGYILVRKTNRCVNGNQVFLEPSTTEPLCKLSDLGYTEVENVPKKGPAMEPLLSEVAPDIGILWSFPELYSVDIVPAFLFRSKSIIERWKKRKRLHAWPSKEMQQEISEMPGYVVKVGTRGSEYEDYEWRICYTTAEIKLVKSLNKVQTMLYYKLKEFVYKVLKLKFPDVTSYIIKNIVFWIAESVHGKYFTIRNLIPLFRSTLFVLKRCVEKQRLPNYMIPERNLFDGKFKDGTTEIFEVLSNWISNCPIIENENRETLRQCYGKIKCSPHLIIQNLDLMPRHFKTTFLPCLLNIFASFSKTTTDYTNLVLDRRLHLCLNTVFTMMHQGPKFVYNAGFHVMQNLTILANKK